MMPASPLFLAQLDVIDASNRLRPTDPDRVSALAASMAEIGLQQPIVVRPHPQGGNRLQLVAGAHRLEGAISLGWTEIAAIWLDVDEAQARLVEIDENLIRNELSAIDFAVSVAERKRIYEALHPETRHGGKRQKKAADDQVVNLTTWFRFSKDAAKRTGLSEATFQRAAALTQRLAPETVDLLRASPIADNGAALKKLAAIEDKTKQIAVARTLAAGEAKNLKSALAAHGLIRIEEVIDPGVAKRIRDQAAVEAFIATSNSKERRWLILATFDHAKSGEFDALTNEVVNHLPHRARLKLKAKLDKALEGYEVEPSDDEAA